MGRIADRMTAGKKMKQGCDKTVGGSWGGHGSQRRICHWGHLPCEDLQEVQSSGEGSRHGTPERQRNREKATEAGVPGMRA